MTKTAEYVGWITKVQAMGYQLGEDGTILSPGKFEGQPYYVPVLWEAALDGDWYECSYVEGCYCCYSRIDERDAEDFPCLSGHIGSYLVLLEACDGFVSHDITPDSPELYDSDGNSISEVDEDDDRFHPYY